MIYTHSIKRILLTASFAIFSLNSSQLAYAGPTDVCPGTNVNISWATEGVGASCQGTADSIPAGNSNSSCDFSGTLANATGNTIIRPTQSCTVKLVCDGNLPGQSDSLTVRADHSGCCGQGIYVGKPNWIGGVCTAAVPTGSFTSYAGCTIPVGGASCGITVRGTISNGISPYLYINGDPAWSWGGENANGTFDRTGWAPQVGPYSVYISIGDKGIGNPGYITNREWIHATCAAGSTWNGSVCAVPTASLSLVEATPIYPGTQFNLRLSGANATMCRILSVSSGSIIHQADTVAANKTLTAGAVGTYTYRGVCYVNDAAPPTVPSGAASDFVDVVVNVVAALVTSGTITSLDTCNVANGASSCLTSFTWTTTNPKAGFTSQVVADVTGTQSNAVNNGTQSLSVNYNNLSPHNFQLYHNSASLAQKGVIAKCQNSSAWSAGLGSCQICQNTGCTAPVCGPNSCTSPVCNNGASNAPVCTPPAGPTASLNITSPTTMTVGGTFTMNGSGGGSATACEIRYTYNGSYTAQDPYRNGWGVGFTNWVNVGLPIPALAGTYVFSNICTNAVGTASAPASQTLTVNAAPAPTLSQMISFNIVPTSLQATDNFTWTWSASNNPDYYEYYFSGAINTGVVTSYNLSGSWTGTPILITAANTPGLTTAWHRPCKTNVGCGAYVSKSFTITTPPAGPTANLTTPPGNPTASTNFTVSYSGTNAQSCALWRSTVNGSFPGGTAAAISSSGAQVVNMTENLAVGTYYYRAICYSGGGFSGTASAPNDKTVNVVVAGLSISLTPSKNTVAAGGETVTLTSGTNNRAASCTASSNPSAGWAGTFSFPLSGNLYTGTSNPTNTITQQTTFTLTCTDSITSEQRTVTATVNVAASPSSCGPGAGTIQNPNVEPAGANACSSGSLNSSSPADTIAAWNWTCGAQVCSAPKWGCTTTTDTNYIAGGANNNWQCANTCANGAANYPTCVAAPGAMSGKFISDGTTCDAAAGQANCNKNVSWTVTNPVQPTSVLNLSYLPGTDLGPFANTASVLMNVNGPSSTFTLKNNGVILANITITVNCLNSTWNNLSGTCAANADAPTINTFVVPSPVAPNALYDLSYTVTGALSCKIEAKADAASSWFSLGSGWVGSPGQSFASWARATQEGAGLVIGNNSYRLTCYSGVAGGGIASPPVTVPFVITTAVPVVTTLSATGITSNSATVNGIVTANKGILPRGQFDRFSPGLTCDAVGLYDATTPPTGDLSTINSFSRTFTGLSPGTDYSFCAQVTNSAGLRGYGNTMSFTTSVLPVPTLSLSLSGPLTTPTGANDIVSFGVPLTLTWGSVLGGTACNIRNGGAQTVLANADVGGGNTTITPGVDNYFLTPNSNTSFTLSCTGSWGAGTVTSTVGPILFPPPPGTPTYADRKQDAKINFRWATAGAGYSNYEVHLFTWVGGTWGAFQSATDVLALSKALDVTPGTAYRARVRTKTGNGAVSAFVPTPNATAISTDLTANQSVITSISNPGGSIDVGSPAKLESLIRNIGTDAPSEGSFSNFFQVASASNGGGAVVSLSSTGMSLPLPSSTGTSTANYTFPSSGTFSVRVCTDFTGPGAPSATGAVVESNEDNNCSLWKDVGVSSPPVVDIDPVGPLNVRVGELIAFTSNASDVEGDMVEHNFDYEFPAGSNNWNYTGNGTANVANVGTQSGAERPFGITRGVNQYVKRFVPLQVGSYRVQAAAKDTKNVYTVTTPVTITVTCAPGEWFSSVLNACQKPVVSVTSSCNNGAIASTPGNSCDVCEFSSVYTAGYCVAGGVCATGASSLITTKCGNNVVESGEECDGGPQGNATFGLSDPSKQKCTRSCTITCKINTADGSPSCGAGVGKVYLQVPDPMVPGGTGSQIVRACTNGALQSSSPTCGICAIGETYAGGVCIPAVCGDTVKNNGEECDGVAGLLAGKTCTSSCCLVNTPPAIAASTILPTYTMTCSGADKYKITKGGVVVDFGNYTVPIIFKPTTVDTYLYTCFANSDPSIKDEATRAANLPPAVAPVVQSRMLLNASQKSISKNSSVSISWITPEPDTSCKILVGPVITRATRNCDSSCIAERQREAKRLSSELYHGNTDQNDGGRSMITALTTKAGATNKASGKKTIQMKYSNILYGSCSDNPLLDPGATRMKVKVVEDTEE